MACDNVSIDAICAQRFIEFDLKETQIERLLLFSISSLIILVLSISRERHILQRYNLACDNVSLNVTSPKTFIEIERKETKIYRSRLGFIQSFVIAVMLLSQER